MNLLIFNDKCITTKTRTYGDNVYANFRRLDVPKDNVNSFFFFLIGIQFMQGWTATTSHGVTRKDAQKRLHDTENLFRKNLQLKDIC